MKTKTKKWEISETEKKIGNILKIVAAVAFLSVWLPAMVHIVGEIIKIWF